MTEPTDDQIVEALERVEQDTNAVVTEADDITITNDEEFEAAGLFLVERVKAVLNELDATFDPIIKAAHGAHKEAVAQKKRHAGPLHDAERIVKGVMATYADEQERIAAAAEQVRLEEARKLAEDVAIAEAARLEREGHHEAAQDRLDQPVTPIVATPPPAPPQAAGVSMRKVAKFRVLDITKVDPKFLMIDKKKVGQVVRSMGEDAATIVGGIEVYYERSVAASAR